MSSWNDSIKHLANNPAIVVVAYICAFLPWAILSALDPINEKWKTIARTRRTGILHLVLSFPPLAYMTFYIHLQRISEDYKEMSAGIYAALFSLFHVLRTLWGLLQLQEFERWNVRALACLLRLGYFPDNLKRKYTSEQTNILCSFLTWMKSWIWPRRSGSTSQIYRLDELRDETLKFTVQDAMLVNNSLIDNNFHNTELPIRAEVPVFGDLPSLWNWKNWSLSFACVEPEETLIRWTATFLSRFASEWLRDCRPETSLEGDWKSRRRAVALQIGQLAVLQYATRPKGKVDIVSLIFPLQCSVPNVFGPSSASNVEVSSWKLVREALPFFYRRKGDEVLRFHRYPQTLRDAISSLSCRAVNNLDDAEYEAVENMTPIHIASFLTMMGEEHWIAISSRDVFDRKLRFAVKPEDNYYQSVLMEQLGFERGTNVSMLTSVLPLRQRVLEYARGSIQTGIHLDNWIALHAGRSLQNIYSEASTNVGSSSLEKNSIFDSQKRLEYMRLTQEATMTSDYGVREAQSVQFYGWLMEGLRQSIEHSILRQSHGEAEMNWNPVLNNTPFRFYCSPQMGEYLKASPECDAEHFNLQSVHLRLLWECNYFLSVSLQNSFHVVRDRENPSFHTAMIRCVLAFPALRISYKNPIRNQRHVRTFIIEPVVAPQKLRLLFSCDTVSYVCSVKIDSTEHAGSIRCTRFFWQDWRDAFLGRVAAQAEWRLSHNLTRVEWLFCESPLRNLNSFLVGLRCKNADAVHELQFLQSWPPFHLKICRLYLQGIVIDSELTSDWIRALEILEKAFIEKTPEGLLGINDTSRIEPGVLNLNELKGQTAEGYGQEKENGDALFSRAEEAFSVRDYGGSCELLEKCVLEYKQARALKRWVSIILSLQDSKCAGRIRYILRLCKVMKLLKSEKECCDSTADLEIVIDDIVRDVRKICERTESKGQFAIAASICLNAPGVGSKIPEIVLAGAETILLKSGPLSMNDDLFFCLGVFLLCRAREEWSSDAEKRGLLYISNFLNADINMKIMFGFWLDTGQTRNEAPFSVKSMFLAYHNPLFHVALDRFVSFLDGHGLGTTERNFFVDGWVTSESRDGRVVIEKMGKLTKDASMAINIYESVLQSGVDSNSDAWVGIISLRLGILHESRSKMAINKSEAIACYKRAMEVGGATSWAHAARNNLSVIQILNYFRINEMGIFELLNHAREGREHSATNNLAVILEQGQVCLRDETRALSLYENAVAKSHPGAMYNLAVSLKLGNIIEKNTARADYLLKRILGNESNNRLTPKLFHQAKRVMQMRDEEICSAARFDLITDEYQHAHFLVKVVVSDLENKRR